MASQSPFTRNPTVFPTIKQSASVSVSSSSVCSTSSLCNYSSMFFTSHTTTPIKRHRIVFSSSPSPSPSPSPSSSSSSSSSSSGARGAKQRRMMKSVDLDSLSSSSKSNSALVGNSDGNRSQSQKMRNLSFKSLFDSRTLWRRILFASRKVRSIILLNVITIVYASNIPVVKEVEANMDPATFTVVRFVVSAIPFIPFVLREQDDVHTRNAGIELGVWVSLGYLMQALGLLTSDAGRASFLSMFTVIVVPLLDGMLGAIVPARTWFGALMSIIGVAMLESSGSPPSVGDLLNFLSAVFFGVHMLRTEHISRSTNKEKFLPLLGYEVCVVATFSTIWYFVGGWLGGVQDYDPSSWTWTMFWEWMVAFPWIPALYTGIFSTGLCLWVEMAAMRDVSAAETAIIYGLEPVWGAGFAWFLLGERWGAAGWTGALLVLVGSLTVQIYGSSSPDGGDENRDEKLEKLQVSDQKNSLSASPVIVSSRKDVSDVVK
ncbi:uncharacterized protein LOC125418780 [Ziziphus jujuba]|uniref:Uncharacterized protein LOC125418780 n=1 Tax=Ziziphus jujuba TaxID=326968 RepID=A0ABM3I2I7_ZIZJJ|nr:uncharacterized protein LOC125418780 [Ziziphus jujuba]